MKKPTSLHLLFLECFTFFGKNESLLFKTNSPAISFVQELNKRFLFYTMTIVGMLFFMTQASFGQNLKPFNIRFDKNIKGDQLMIGNNILSQDNTNFDDKDTYNHTVEMKYVDIDGDNTTFSSSSAELTVPNSNAPLAACYKIAYAALYWSAIIKEGDNTVDRTKFTSIKFKTPVGGYNDITGELIYDAINQSGGIGDDKNRPYACYADVTSLVKPLTDANGTYTVANVLSSVGKNKMTGLSAGWSLYIVYEDPKLPARSITSYDGFSGISGTTTLDITVSGFRTIPKGPVKGSFAFAALEGDKKIEGDYLEINGVTQSAATATGTTLRPTDNFFNSSITYIDPSTKKTANFTAPNRTPASSNTLGYDAGIIELKNDNNSAIKNDATSAKITLGSTGDVYFYYFNAIAVEVIEPKIILTKKVLKGGVDAANQPVKLSDILTYELQFQNVGNDNAKSFTIEDKLPVNTIFNYPADIETPLQAGVTHSYNSTTRTITFTVQDNLVTKNGNLSIPIRFKVQVVPTCANLTEPCNNIIKNTAKSKYTGEINTNDGKGFGEDSFSSYSACDISVPESTNFLVGVDDCKKRNDVLCGDNVTISATGGYASYSWSTSPTGLPVIGTSQTLTVTKPGTYYVKNTATPPCVDLEEIITVADYAAKPKNPLIDIADNINPATGLIDECVNDGSVLPKFFLCGKKAYKDINLSSLGATRITWEKTTCVPDPNLSDLCANVSPSCTWTTAIPDANTFRADTAGQYRVSIYFGGCFSRFYFNVYKNELDYTVDKKDMICGKNGSITINGVGADYEYSLSKNSGYTLSNTFSITTEGTYTVYIRQVGVATNPCIFEEKNIPIYKIVFNPIAPTITQPLCHDSKGSIKVYGTAYNGAQYTYELFKAGVSIEKVINSTASEYEFTGKDAGVYTYTVSTLDGCTYNGTAEIIAPAALTASPAITKPLTCENGEITVTPKNGTAPYYYYVNGSITSQTDPKIVITTAGTYSIKVVDKNNCEYTIPDIKINANPKPEFSVAKTDILCYGTNSGTITFSVTNPNGYTLAFSKDNGATFVPNGSFTDLAPGTYTPVLRYTLSGVNCFEKKTAITITEPTIALTASAGVSELAGCGDVALGIPKNYGKVRITNPQGGTPFAGANPYLFNFNNPANPADWTTVNEAYKAPGTYTVYVKDANNCIFSAPVIIDPEPVAPQIDVNTPVDFNCDGTATSTVTVANPGGSTYTYNYYIDGKPNTPITNNVFTNVQPGEHKVTVEYKLNAVPTFSNLLFEDFGKGGYTTIPGISPLYCFEDETTPHPATWPALCGKITDYQINDGKYAAASSIKTTFGVWLKAKDHTLPSDPLGRFLCVNIGKSAGIGGILYSKPIKDVIPNQPVIISLWAENLIQKKYPNYDDPKLTIQLINDLGLPTEFLVATTPIATPWVVPKSDKWEYNELSLNPGTYNNLSFVIRSYSTEFKGNDVLLDDIKVFQLPKTCLSTKDFTIVVPTGKAFTAQITGTKNVTCNGLTNGEITIAAQNFDAVTGYQYSLDNGANWDTTVITTSPYKITNLKQSLYKVVVRPVGSSVEACAKPFEVTIAQPNVLQLNPTVVTHVSCLATGTATINAIGGTGTYTYTVTPKLPVGPAIVQVNNNKFIGLGAGVYSVSVKDINDCTTIGSDFTIDDKILPTASIDITSAYCAGGAGATLQVTPDTQANYTYSINGGAVKSDGTFAGLTPGKYTIRVTDTVTGCFIDLPEQTIALPITASTTVVADLDCDVVPASPDASIQVTIANGYPDYSYKVNTTGAPFTGTPTQVGLGLNIFTYSAATAGTYYFEITDTNGCTTVVSRTINPLVKPDFSTTQVHVKCKAEATGSITVTGIPASGTYTYSKDNGVTFQASNVFPGLTAGDYQIVIKDAKKCLSNAKTVTITEPLVGLTATADVTTKLTCGIGNVSQAATITVTAQDGTPFSGVNKYRYSYNSATPVTSNTYTTNTVGPVTVVVYDANGCSYTVPVAPVVDPLNPPTALIFTPANDITCDPSKLDTDVTVSFSNGVGPFKVEITSTDAAIAPVAPVATGVATNSHTFANLAPGTYFFKVTDANNCTLTGQYKIDPVVPIQVSGAIVSNVTCNGAADGVLKFTVSGNTATTDTYTLVGSVTGTIPGGVRIADVITYTGVKGGETYTFTITNTTTKCFATATVSLSQPAAITALAATASKVFCTKPQSTIKVTAIGGTAPLQFAVVKSGFTPVAADYNTTGIFIKDTSVDGLTYVAYVKDKNGNCSQNIPVNVVQDAEPTVDPVTAQCYSGTPFTITMTGTVFSGSAIQYGINGVYTTNPVKTISAAGSYNLTVKDDNGCISPVVIYDVKDQLTITAKLDKDLTCSLLAAAQITLSAGGGTSTYTYAYRLAPSPIYITLPGNVYNPTVAGDYYFRVTSGGCTRETTVPVKVNPTALPVFTIANGNTIKCNGDSTGSITVTIDQTVGIAPYTINVFNSTLGLNYGTQTSGLRAGDYTITVTDGKGCFDTRNINISQPLPITISFTPNNITCVPGTGVSKGSIVVNSVSGGTGIYTYQVTNNTGDIIPIVTSDGLTPVTFDLINFGIYQLTVIDASGCSKIIQDIKIASPPDKLDLAVTPTTPVCGVLGSAVVKATIPFPGPLGFFFAIYKPGIVYTVGDPDWFPEDGLNSLQTTIPDLIPGVTYTFVVYDSNTQCYYYETFTNTVPSGSSLTSIATPVNITCVGSADGAVNLGITSNYGGNINVKYEIFNSATLLSTGIVDNGVVNANSTLNIANFGAKPLYTGLPYGTYYVLITETSGLYAGCAIATLPFSITESAVVLSLTASSPKNDNCINNAGEVVAVPSGGTGPFLYQIVADNLPIGFGPEDTQPTSASFVSPTHDSNTFNVESGNYIVWVKDANGCIKDATATVILDLDPVFALTVPNRCAAEGSFTVDVVVTDPTLAMAPYAISVNGGAFVNFSGLTYTLTGLNSGLNQSITIQNKNGCPETQLFNINATPLATAVVSKVLDCSVSPTAVANATITVTITKGTGDFTYAVKKGTGSFGLDMNVGVGLTSFDYPVASADADTYVFQIKDANGCIVETNEVVVDPIIPIVPAYTPIQPLCNGGTGTIELAATGGKAPYTYNFNNLGFTDTFVYAVSAGTYPYIIKDALGCEVTGSAILGEPSAVVVGTPIITPLTCGPGNVGQAATVDLSLVASGGSGAYTYSFNGSAFSSQTSYTVNDTGADQMGIQFAVQDANGCTASGTVDILKLNPPTNFVITPTDVITCTTTDTDVTISNVVNAVGPVTTGLTYQIISPTFVPNGNNPVFTNLVPGNYVFQVTDTNGCVKQLPYEIKDVIKIDIVAQSTTAITCFTDTDGKASFFVSGFGTGVGTYHYEVDGVAVASNVSSPNIDLINLDKGPHTIEVFDDVTNCFKSILFTIDAPTAALVLDPLDVTPLGCTTFGAVTIVAKDGWGTYEYTVTQPDLTVLTNNTGVFGGLTQTGAYNISVKDANGCVVTDSFSLITATPPTATIDVTTNYCYDGTNGATLIVNAATTSPFVVTPFEYSIDSGVTFQVSNTFNNLTPGSYNVVVKDAFGCQSTVPVNAIIEPQLFANAVATKEIFCIAPINGSIKITATGGYGPYSYKVSTDNGVTFPGVAIPFVNATDTDFSVPAAASYVFEVTDSKGCVFVTTPPVIMVDPTPVDLLLSDIDVTPVDCTAPQGTNNNGTITVNLRRPVNDNPDYTYALSGTANRPAQPSNIFTGLTPGIYTVTVTSGRGCFDSQDVTIGEPAPIDVTAIATPFGCDTGNSSKNATITVTGVTGGSGTYLQYEFIKDGNPIPVQKSDNPIYIEADLLGGSYIVNVYDENGCPGTSAPITIAPYIQLDKVNVVVDQAITCTYLENITVSVSTIGGTPSNLEFTVQDVTYDAATGTIPSYGTNYKDVQTVTVPNASFINLPIGNYVINVKNLDTNCEIIGVHYVNNPNTFELLVDNVVDVICLNDANGSARVTLVDRVPTPDKAGEFDYTVTGPTPSTGTSTPAGGVDLTNLAVGTYTITATLNQAPSCTVSKNFTITGPNEALEIFETHTEITCVAGNNDGSISATATGGWPGGYEFRLEETLAGTLVADWSTTSTFNGLTAGNYVVKVRDRSINGCVDSVVVPLVNPTPITFTATPSTTILTCKGDTNATITVNLPVTGGQGTNYLYTLNTISANPVISSGPQADPVFTNLGAGTYTVTVTDGWGCGTPSGAISITEPTEVVASLVLATTQTCLIQSTLTLSATGGTGTYTYSADGSFNPTGSLLTYGTFATTTTILNVPVGTYRYYVRDANQCISVVSNDIKIEPLPVLKVDLDVQNPKINCRGDANGVIVATATGGLGNYVYTLLDGVGGALAFTPVQTTPGNFTQLPAGTYSVRVDSGVDCFAFSVSEVIEEPLTSLTASSVPTPITCNGAANGIITVTASGGTGAIKYAISPQMDQFFDTGVFDQLAPGTYQIIVQDANGCFVLLSEEITEPQPIFVNTVPGSEDQEVCAGDLTGGFDITVSGGVAPYSVSIDNINGTYFTGTATQNVFAFTGLTGGDHTVYIKDFNGCTAEWLVALDKSVNLDPKASVVYGCEFNSPSNTVTVALDASVDPTLVDYALDGATVFQPSNIFKNVAPGFHTITARHANSCEKTTTSFEVKGYEQLTLSLADGGLNEIVATAAAGAGNYKYSFDGGNSFSTNNKFIFYKSGDYTVMVRDANGCEATATRYFEFIDIKIPNVFTPNGDGNNDTWLPTNTINYKDLTISIFDRYGRKIANLRVGQGWDGRYNSLELPTGDYWYILKLKNEQDDREFVGHFTLMR